jgi:SAM-dependent methyltransferase
VNDFLYFALDSPKPQHVRFGVPNRFTGMVFDSRGIPITCLRATFDGRLSAEIPVDLASEDIARHLPHLPETKNCRFDSPMFIVKGSEVLSMEAVDREGRARPMFEYDLAEIRRSAAKLSAMARGLDEIPAPPGEIVFLTQGHSDSASYQDSIIPGVMNLKRYLAAAGVSWESLRSILDFGCGSGRLLVGWHLDDPGRSLSGCDINSQLVGWARSSLPGSLAFHQISKEPPTAFRDGSFDFISVVSVFTHSSFPLQERWVRELWRILKPGGILLATLHGSAYIDLFLPDRRREFETAGHIELARAEEGSNEFAAFHHSSAIGGLFRGFELLAHYPSGKIGPRRILFPLAAFQDVYVLRAIAI